MAQDSTVDKEQFTDSSYVKNLLTPGSLPHREIETFYMDEEMIHKTCLDVSWSNCDARTFDVRVGPNYVPGQKQPSEKAIYSVFACDGFKMPYKINHIARFMNVKSYIEEYNTPYHPKTWGLPPIIIINVMTPNYPPEMMSGKDNGDGYQLVFYARLSNEAREILDNYHEGKLKQLPPSIQLFRDFIHSNLDSPLRQRFKCLARIMNINYSGFSFLTKNLISQYNGKPFLARTSSTFYHEPGKYFAADIDAHLFGFPSRKGLSYMKDCIKNLVYDAAFIIEGHSDNELPEQVLCCARVSRIGVEQAAPFPLEFVEIASNKNHSQHYSKLHLAHLLKKNDSENMSPESKDVEGMDEDTAQEIEVQDRYDELNSSQFSDANDEEATRILKEISLDEQKSQEEYMNTVGLDENKTIKNNTDNNTNKNDNHNSNSNDKNGDKDKNTNNNNNLHSEDSSNSDHKEQANKNNNSNNNNTANDNSSTSYFQSWFTKYS